MKQLQRKFDFVWFVLTTECNSCCSYCWVMKLRKKTEKMSVVTAHAAMAFVVESAAEGAEVQMFGGEPLIEFKLVKHLFSRYPNMNYTMFTNGRLLDGEKLEFFKEYGDFVRVVFSIDGNKETQVANRGYWFDNMDVIEKALHELPNVGVRMTVMEPDKAYEDAKFLCGLGSPRVDINVPTMAGLGGNYKECLSQVYERIKGSDFGSRVHYVDACEIECKYCSIGTKRIAISPDGALYPCDVFGIMNVFKVGDVFRGIDEGAMEDFMNELPSMRDPKFPCAAEKYVMNVDWFNKNPVVARVE